MSNFCERNVAAMSLRTCSAMFGMLNATLGIPGLPNLLPEAKSILLLLARMLWNKASDLRLNRVNGYYANC